MGVSGRSAHTVFTGGYARAFRYRRVRGHLRLTGPPSELGMETAPAQASCVFVDPPTELDWMMFIKRDDSRDNGAAD
jgi:hypothetical protein